MKTYEIEVVKSIRGKLNVLANTYEEALLAAAHHLSENYVTENDLDCIDFATWTVPDLCD